MKDKRRWLAEDYREATERHPERGYPFRNLSDLPIDPIYTHQDLEGFDPETQLAYPGEYPFTRGVQTTMYRGKLWTMRMFAGLGTA